MFKRNFVGFCCLLALGATQLASADVSFGSSRSFVLSADLHVSDTGPFGMITGDLVSTAPSPYALTHGPNESPNGELPLLSGTLQGGISSTVDFGVGSRQTQASVQLTDFLLELDGIFTLTGDELSAFAEATGDFGTLSVNGSFGADNVALDVLGTNVALSAGEVYNQNGLRIFYQDGTSSVTGEAASISATAFLVLFDDFLFEDATYNGSIALGFARAEQRAVPEPGSLLALALAGLCYAKGRRTKKQG